VVVAKMPMASDDLFAEADMNFAEHENYAKMLLSSLAGDHVKIGGLIFVPKRTQSRNAAQAMTGILCHRLAKNSTHEPQRTINTTYEWEEGIFNCRNIADRGHLWTNIRRTVADLMHDYARNKPVAYLLAFSNPSDKRLRVWALPEPIVHSSVSRLPVKAGGDEYSLRIFADKQRVENDPASPNLAQYFQEFRLSQRELMLLRKSREMDDLVRRERAIARGKDAPDSDDDDGSPTTETDTYKYLAIAEKQLTEEGVFDPSGISDARERALSSIVRRRGQPVFRQRLLTAYNGRCAISGCNVEQVLDAAHIVPYMSRKTNHVGNGLLLRTDMHALFDLKLVTVDGMTMRLLVSPSLSGTAYEEYHGRQIHVPDDLPCRPSRQALEQHRKESGL
jgi:hypothetical protein